MIYFKHSNTKIQRRSRASAERLTMINMKEEVRSNRKVLLFIGLIVTLLTLQVALFGIFGTRGTELAKVLSEEKQTSETITKLEGDIAKLRAINTISEKTEKLNLVQAKSVIEITEQLPTQLASSN